MADSKPKSLKKSKIDLNPKVLSAFLIEIGYLFRLVLVVLEKFAMSIRKPVVDSAFDDNKRLIFLFFQTYSYFIFYNCKCTHLYLTTMRCATRVYAQNLRKCYFFLLTKETFLVPVLT